MYNAGHLRRPHLLDNGKIATDERVWESDLTPLSGLQTLLRGMYFLRHLFRSPLVVCGHAPGRGHCTASHEVGAWYKNSPPNAVPSI